MKALASPGGRRLLPGLQQPELRSSSLQLQQHFLPVPEVLQEVNSPFQLGNTQS